MAGVSGREKFFLRRIETSREAEMNDSAMNRWTDEIIQCAIQWKWLQIC